VVSDIGVPCFDDDSTAGSGSVWQQPQHLGVYEIVSPDEPIDQLVRAVELNTDVQSVPADTRNDAFNGPRTEPKSNSISRSRPYRVISCHGTPLPHHGSLPVRWNKYVRTTLSMAAAAPLSELRQFLKVRNVSP
jgi:hypothetical protein